MAKPTPMSERAYMSPYLSDLPGLKVFVRCPLCNLQYQWDAMALLERLSEDGNLPTILTEIRKNLGCDRALKWAQFYDPQCALVYDSEKMDRENAGIKYRLG